MEAELVAVSAEVHLVRRFVSELLGEPEAEQETEEPAHPTRALEIVQEE